MFHQLCIEKLLSKECPLCRIAVPEFKPVMVYHWGNIQPYPHPSYWMYGTGWATDTGRVMTKCLRTENYDLSIIRPDEEKIPQHDPIVIWIRRLDGQLSRLSISKHATFHHVRLVESFISHIDATQHRIVHKGVYIIDHHQTLLKAGVGDGDKLLIVLNLQGD
jgi:hypothetical protein